MGVEMRKRQALKKQLGMTQETLQDLEMQLKVLNQTFAHSQCVMITRRRRGRCTDTTSTPTGRAGEWGQLPAG